MIRGAGAVLPEQTVATFDVPVQVWDWSRDGKALLIGKKSADTGDDLWIQPPAEGAAAQPYWTKPFDQAFGVIAPDGRAIAYASNESGQFDIYVDAFPKPGNARASRPRAGRNRAGATTAATLFFRRQSAIQAAKLTRASSLVVDSVAQLFDLGVAISSYDVSRDGRFLVNIPAAAVPTPPAMIVTNWKPREHN